MFSLFLPPRVGHGSKDMRDPFKGLLQDGGVGESPAPRTKRASFTNFFAFSSKRRSSQLQLQTDFLVPPQAVAGKWVAGTHLVHPASIPSPLRADEEEYYYSYYPSSHSVSPHTDPSERSPSKQLVAHSPPVDKIHHPYAYSTPLHAKPATPSLRHVSSQPLHPDSPGRLPSSHHGHDPPSNHPHLLRPEIKTSMSTPNLASATSHVRPRSLLRKRPTRTKERWLSAESWWNALFSPSPRFRVKQACPNQPVNIVHPPVSPPPRAEPIRHLGVTFPSIQAARPRALSATAPASSKPVPISLTRSRSALELNNQPSTSANPRLGFEPALETLADTPTPPPDGVAAGDCDLPPPDPPLSLAQVLDEGEAFEQQRAQWKKQAARSLGNKHTRSFSRARSKSLGERHARLGQQISESSKSHLNLEFLAARTLLGSQSMMPVVVTKPNSSSSHSKARSYSHSHSAYSHSHSSHSRAYSHSHSHSLTTSHSSKSSRHLPPRGHSRTGSWSKTAFLKAGSLCGIGQDNSHIISVDERVPSSSRVDVQGVIYISEFTTPEPVPNADKVSPTPSGEVGIAISSSPPPDVEPSVSVSWRHESDQESRWSSRHTHKSSDYAGPHRSIVVSNLPQIGATSDVSLRHRLPPRAVIHPPISPIVHPYQSVTVRSDQAGNKRGAATTPNVTDGQETVEPDTRCSPHPHLSLTHADFERYGVGEALVYASCERSKAPEVKRIVQSEPSPVVESRPPDQHSPSCDTILLPFEERDTSSLGMSSIPSLTHSTIQMVMSAFDNPDDLDEFQDLFYKPHPIAGQQRDSGMTTDRVPTDIDDSTPSSPLTHLLRKLSEEVKSLRNPSRTPSDPISLQRSESQDRRSNEGGKFVFMDVARLSSSPPPMETSPLRVTIQQDGCGSTAQHIRVIPEDVHSSYTSSVLESPAEDRENDTFGYPIKHGQLEAVTAPAPIQSPLRVSTHLSIQENEDDEDETFLSPVTKRFGLASTDAVRASYVTTSDLSRMSGLSDFPLPPGVRPLSILQAYFEATPISPTSQNYNHSEDEMEHAGRSVGEEGDEEDVGQPGDVTEALRALRMTSRVTSYESRRSTFGASDSDDMDYITRLHQTES